MHVLLARAWATGVLWLAVSLVVSSCTTTATGGFTATRAIEHGPESPNGLVVVGIRTRDTTPEVSVLGVKANSSLEFTWRAFDYASDKVLFGDQYYSSEHKVFTGRYNCDLYRDHPDCQDNDYTRVQYNVVRVQAGHYLFESMRIGKGRAVFLLPRQQGFLYQGSAKATYDLGLLPGFEIAAGEIVYVGDYVFSASRELPRLVGMESTPDGAREALAAYPNVRGTMQVQVIHSRLLLPTERDDGGNDQAALSPRRR